MRDSSFDSFAKLEEIVNNSQIERIESTINLESPERYTDRFSPDLPGYFDFDRQTTLNFPDEKGKCYEGPELPRKEHIVSVGLDKRLKIYHVMAQKQVLEIGKENISDVSQIKAVGITPDAKFLFTLDNKNLKQWELTKDS
jgi:hypothetical protein